jgi:hypothetical protein
MCFNGESSGTQISVAGPFIQPVVLIVVVSDSGVELSIGIEPLNDIAISSWLRIMKPPATLPALLKKAPATLRLVDESNRPLFQVGVAEADTTERRQVLNCGIVLIDSNSAIGHSAYHMLHTPTLVKHQEPCPLCLGPSSRCPAFLVKTGSNQLQPRIMCEVFAPGSISGDPNTGVKFTASGMLKSTQNMPSTNVPIVCPACDPALADPMHLPPKTPAMAKAKLPSCRRAVMKYNMRAHWADVHGSSPMPAGLIEALRLSPNEGSLLSANKEQRLQSFGGTSCEGCLSFSSPF